jgi:hypothetical protein
MSMTREELDELMNSDREKIVVSTLSGLSYKLLFVSKKYAILEHPQNGEHSEFLLAFLNYYSIPKPQDEIETLYECIGEDGNLFLAFSDDTYPNFNSKKKRPLTDLIVSIARKTGREFKLNMRTWELITT